MIHFRLEPLNGIYPGFSLLPFPNFNEIATLWTLWTTYGVNSLLSLAIDLSLNCRLFVLRFSIFYTILMEPSLQCFKKYKNLYV